MNRLTDLSGVRRCIGPQLTTTALAAVILSGLWLAAAQAQAADTAAQAQTPGSAAQPLRLAANGPIQFTIGATNVPPAPADGGSKTPTCTSAASEAEQVVLPIGKSRMLSLPEPVRTRTLGNPSIVQAMLVSPQTLYLLGLDVGTTNMIMQGKSGRCSVIDVIVGADPGGLQATLHSLLPEAKRVRVSAAADSLVLTGTVTDSVQAQKILDIANAFVMRQIRSPLQAPPQQTGAPGAPMLAMNGGNMGGMGFGGLGAGTSGGQPLRSPRIINMMSVEAPQQVMLEVKVAEVSKTLIDQMGAAVNLNGAFGSWTFGLLANFLSGATDLLSFSKANNLPLKFAMDAQKGDGLVKILAEPNLMAISGQEGSFLAGGKVFIPVPQSTGTGGTTIVLQEETFGVGLRFTPTVLENGRINLKVSPEVSELSPTGVALTAPNVAGTSILPLINTRRASTTLQVMDGQSFAIGGLIKSNTTGSLKGLPGVGELPVVGALLRSTNFQQDRTELLFVVTPRLVKPLPANYPLPTDSFGPSIPGEVYINGNMEGHPASQPANNPAPAALPAPAAPAAPSAAPTTSIAPPAATAVTAADAGPTASTAAAPGATQ
ncbi:type II and III secretion system protein family protein [Cupriavidus basilensis]|uniref:type II and III secretion system protein family protein n=1 Tax=Cupriavidus basilensis TaxID=68895 RepID=UPI0023E8CEC9|nr:type II and III secretion system protein family protein [Cupriavidus basilensis]MDF3883903.1 type II and III secretion system protein family protein [Cupriavidus basilensis]